MTFQFRTTILAASAFLVLAGTGQAATLAYLRDAPGGTNSAGNPSGVFLTGAVRSGVGSINSSWSGGAGAFDFELSLNGASGDYFSLLTYCGDPLRSLTVGPSGGLGGEFSVVTMGAFGYSARAIDAIQLLWGNAFADSQTSATKASAFQFLIWEYIADSVFDLAAGVIKVSDTDVQNQVNVWNSNLGGWTTRASLLVLDGLAENKQSFFLQQTSRPVPESPTPEPATYAMIGAGLLALVYARRRK